MVVPRFGEIATFMRLPIERDPARLDIAIVGVPWDGGTTFRPGARHGPREMRNMSTLMRRVHHATLVSPYELCRVGDHGDTPVNPIDLQDSLARIEAFFATLHAAGAVPLSAGGDHLITLPILEGGRPRAVGRGHPFRRPFRHLGRVFRRPEIHARNALSPGGRGGSARPQAHDSDRDSRLDLFRRRKGLG